MMMENRNSNNMLKEALNRREGNGLPFNFSYRMMEKVRLEAEKKRKKQRFLITSYLIAGCLIIVGLLVYFLFFYMKIDIDMNMPVLDLEAIKTSKPIFDFYWYIGALAMILLGGDYWLRKKVRQKREH